MMMVMMTMRWQNHIFNPKVCNMFFLLKKLPQKYAINIIICNSLRVLSFWFDYKHFSEIVLKIAKSNSFFLRIYWRRNNNSLTFIIFCIICLKVLCAKKFGSKWTGVEIQYCKSLWRTFRLFGKGAPNKPSIRYQHWTWTILNADCY